jgi:hypothetical protein
MGEDNLWTWASIGETIIKYADAFHIKEQTMVFDRQKASLPSALLLRIILATSVF